MSFCDTVNGFYYWAGFFFFFNINFGAAAFGFKLLTFNWGYSLQNHLNFVFYSMAIMHDSLGKCIFFRALHKGTFCKTKNYMYNIEFIKLEKKSYFLAQVKSKSDLNACVNLTHMLLELGTR